MASIGKWLALGSGACIGLAWRKNAATCPDLLRLETTTALGATVAVDFAGRGKLGATCGGGDTYVTFTSFWRADIDIWKAYADGVWTSSTTIDVYMDGLTAIAKDLDVYPIDNYSAFIRKSGIIRDTVNCGTVVKATVTVNDDGTFSIV
jgi:hypothetical protein